VSADELRDSVRGFFEQYAPVRGQLADDASTWKRITAEMGLTGLAVPEQTGGSGASFAELAVVLEEAGRCLLRAPLLSTAVAAHVLAGAGADDQLPALLDGSGSAAIVTDPDSPVADAAGSTLLLVAANDELEVVETSTATVTPLDAMDPTRPVARVSLDGAPRRRIGDAAGALDLLHVALAAESVGVARRAMDMAVQYAKEREQFGRPIGAYQAISHACAQMLLEVEGARSTTLYAAWALDHEPESGPLAASMAKAYASDAGWRVPASALQVHGGIGFTWEHDLHLWLKRGKANAYIWGDARAHRDRVADGIGL
jgi:alkylation response protein AidB-like acyl-CoA dehydrogenase